MKPVAISLLLKIVNYIVGGDFLEIVKSLVLAAASTAYVDIEPSADFPEGISANQQRKLEVTAQLNRLKNDLNPKIRGFGGWLVSIAIDTVVGQLQTKKVI
jgi:hypothetical protein